MGHIFDRIVLEIVNGNTLGQTAGITLPGAEIAKDLVIGNLAAVRRKGGEPTFNHGQRFGQSSVDTDAVGTLGPTVRSIAAREKENALAVWKPSQDLVMNSHTIVELSSGALIERELLGLSAISGHKVDVEIAVILASEGDPFTIGRELREQLASRAGSDTSGDAA